MSVQNTRYGAKGIAALIENKKKIFFIGIGGISMSSLAHISHRNGYEVAGSDRSESAILKKLESEGVQIFYSHSAENVLGYDLVVYTVAISEDNPEYVAARENGIPTVSHTPLCTREKTRRSLAVRCLTRWAVLTETAATSILYSRRANIWTIFFHFVRASR